MTELDPEIISEMSRYEVLKAEDGDGWVYRLKYDNWVLTTQL